MSWGAWNRDVRIVATRILYRAITAAVPVRYHIPQRYGVQPPQEMITPASWILFLSVMVAMTGKRWFLDNSAYCRRSATTNKGTSQEKKNSALVVLQLILMCSGGIVKTSNLCDKIQRSVDVAASTTRATPSLFPKMWVYRRTCIYYLLWRTAAMQLTYGTSGETKAQLGARATPRLEWVPPSLLTFANALFVRVLRARIVS